MEGNIERAKQTLLSVSIEELTKDLLEEMFAAYYDKASKEYKESNYETTDEIILTNKEYPHIREPKIETTLGTLAFNRHVLEGSHCIQHIGFQNYPIDKEGLNKLDRMINVLLIQDKITPQELALYIDRRDQFGFWFNAFNSAALSASLVRPMVDVNKKKDMLFDQYKEQLNSNDSAEQILAINKIEKELMTDVRKNLESDYGYDLYRSGDGNLDNNYKTINVMRGAVMNEITGKYDTVKASLMDGITKEDIPAFSNSVVAGAYPSAVGTAEAGAMSKIILAILQSIHLDTNKNSDCGTKSTIPFTITAKNSSYVLFRNIAEGGKVVMLNHDNISKYIGKTVRMYSPQCCTHKDICAKCAGHTFLNLGVDNAGLLVTEMTDKLLNLKLKSKHDLSQSAKILSPEECVIKPTQNLYCDEHDNHFMKNKTTMRMFIPRVLEEISGFVNEDSLIITMGLFPIKFYDKNDNVIEENFLTIPAMVTFNKYSVTQEDENYYIVSYDPESAICKMTINQHFVNCEFFINQVYLYSKSPQIPYNMLTELMFKCFEINKTDLRTPALGYEFLARRLCQTSNGESFAFAYGKDPNIDQMSYKKFAYREAVQKSGALQGILFQDLSTSANYGLAETLRGNKPEPTPLEYVIKA